MDRLQLRLVDVCVDLRRGQIGMTEQLLKDSQIGPTGKQVRRETMAERVRRKMFVNPGDPGVLADQSPDVRTVERSPCAG